MKINSAVPKDNSISSMSSQWQQATTQRLTTRTKTGFLSITPTSVSRVWRPEEQFHPTWKEGSNTALPGTSEPWNSVAVLWVYTHKRTNSFLLKKNLRAIDSWRRLQDSVLLHTWIFFPAPLKKFHVCIISAASTFCCFRNKRFFLYSLPDCPVHWEVRSSFPFGIAKHGILQDCVQSCFKWQTHSANSASTVCPVAEDSRTEETKQ